MKFHEQRTANGLQLVAELNPNVQSVGIGFFVRTGSRDETTDVSGVSHFLEHMVFKGAEKYTAEDVNRIFDEVGAKYNASTSEEITLFYAAILPEYLPQTFELLADILYPSLRVEDFDMEKQVILEEIGMYDDLPTFTAYEQAMQDHFAGHPLGRSILGTTDSVGELPAEKMQQYHADHYKTGNITLAVAGNANWDELLALTEKHCGHWPSGSHERPTDEARPVGGVKVITKPNSIQQHVMQMSPAPPAHNELRFASELLSVIVGDDSGSRMFWDMVDTGLAEVCELGYNEYDGSGTYLTYLGCDPDKTAENLQRIHAIYEAVNRSGVTQTELEQAKNKVTSRIVLRSERPMGRLSSLGGNWVYRQEYRSVADDLKVLKEMTLDDIHNLLEVYPLGQLTTVTIGPLESLEFKA